MKRVTQLICCGDTVGFPAYSLPPAAQMSRLQTHLLSRGLPGSDCEGLRWAEGSGCVLIESVLYYRALTGLLDWLTKPPPAGHQGKHHYLQPVAVVANTYPECLEHFYQTFLVIFSRILPKEKPLDQVLGCPAKLINGGSLAGPVCEKQHMLSFNRENHKTKCSLLKKVC